jgi:hypothetical protein
VPLTAFVSYSWDGPAHREWVRRFADDLMRNGIATTLDQYDLDFGDDRFAFMETAVRESGHIIVVCTPEYVRRANAREGGVGVEAVLITPGIYEQNGKKRFIPIIRSSDDSTPLTPDFLASRVYVDFRDDSEYSQKIEELLRSIHGQPRHTKPVLGPVPDLRAERPTDVTRLTSLLRRSPRSFEFLRTVAGFSSTDDEFRELIIQHPDLLQSAHIVKRDEHGQRVIPGRPGIQLKDRERVERRAGNVSVSGDVSAGNGKEGPGGNVIIEGGTGRRGASGGDVDVGAGTYRAGDGGPGGPGGDIVIMGGDAE